MVGVESMREEEVDFRKADMEHSSMRWKGRGKGKKGALLHSFEFTGGLNLRPC